jgi:flagellin
MGMVINTNVDALNALRNLSATSNQFSSSVQKLSSGLRITTAADDAAGLAISNKLSAQVTGLNQAQRNAQDGVSMVQTAEGALTEVQSMLQRIRELAVQAANATVGQSDAKSINTEVTALQAEIQRIASTTTFNGQHLLDGSMSGTSVIPLAAGSGVQVGTAVNAGTAAAVTAVNVSGAAAATTYTISSAGGNITLSGNGLSQTLSAIGGVGAQGSTVYNFDKMGVSITVGAGSATSAAQVQAGLAALTVQTGAATAATAATFQVGANSGDTLGVAFGDATANTLLGTTAIANFSAAANGATWATASGASTVGVAVSSALISQCDTAIDALNNTDANLGAVENRLNHTIAAVGVASTNLDASESRIKDLNVAAEMVTFTKTQILQQAGTAILAQANSAPQNVLTLLR